jgi:hypothetical protein
VYINCAKKTPIAHANDARVGAAKLTGWLVVGRSAGLTVGPFVGGLLYTTVFGNSLFNGTRAPGGVWQPSSSSSGL